MKGRTERLRGAWSGLTRDQRFAGLAAAALLVTMFLPWYEKSYYDPRLRRPATDTLSAFGAVSFVEAAIFLVAVGVMALVLLRGEGRSFHLPGGDGTVVFAAGMWAALLIFYRVFDGPSVSGNATVGIQWGFFPAFVAAGAIAYTGQRLRLAARPVPPVTDGSRDGGGADDDDDDLFGADDEPRPRARRAAGASSEASTAIVPSSEAVTDVATPRRPRPSSRAVTREDAEQLTFDEPPEPPLQPGEIPPARDRG